MKRARRYAYRGRLVVGVPGAELVATGRPAPKGTAPLPKALRPMLAEVLDQPDPTVLGPDGKPLTAAHHDRALKALDRLAGAAGVDLEEP